MGKSEIAIIDLESSKITDETTVNTVGKIRVPYKEEN